MAEVRDLVGTADSCDPGKPADRGDGTAMAETCDLILLTVVRDRIVWREAAGDFEESERSGLPKSDMEGSTDRRSVFRELKDILGAEPENFAQKLTMI
jgi:hypothetical protein